MMNVSLTETEEMAIKRSVYLTEKQMLKTNQTTVYKGLPKHLNHGC